MRTKGRGGRKKVALSITDRTTLAPLAFDKFILDNDHELVKKEMEAIMAKAVVNDAEGNLKEGGSTSTTHLSRARAGIGWMSK